MKLPYTQKQILFNPAHDRTLRLIAEPNMQDPNTISHERISYLQCTVQKLLEIVSDTDVYLGGGLAIAYTLARHPPDIIRSLVPQHVTTIINGYYRDYAALDLLCMEDKRERLMADFEENNILLSRRLRPMFKVWKGTKWEGYEPVRKDEFLQAIRDDYIWKNHRGINIKKGFNDQDNQIISAFNKEDIDDYINVFFHHYETKDHEPVQRVDTETFLRKSDKKKIYHTLVEVVSNEEGIRVPLRYFEGCRYMLARNISLKIAHPFYLLRVKIHALEEKNKDDARHELDITILENLLTYLGQDVSVSEILRPQIE